MTITQTRQERVKEVDEGELERQSLLPFMCRNHKQWVRRVNVRKAIDSAKKDFPETWIDPRGKTLIKNYEEVILRLQEIEKYKKKWFGELQQTS